MQAMAPRRVPPVRCTRWAPTARVVEYHDAARDHWFMTADEAEIAKLDKEIDEIKEVKDKIAALNDALRKALAEERDRALAALQAGEQGRGASQRPRK